MSVMNINVIALPKWSRNSLVGTVTRLGKYDKELGIRPDKCQDSTLN